MRTHFLFSQPFRSSKLLTAPLLFILGGFLTSAVTPAHADGPATVAVPLTPPTPASAPAITAPPPFMKEVGVKLTSYPGPRLADIAPAITLPTPEGRLWSSTDLQGEWSTVWVLVQDFPAANPPVVVKSPLEQLVKIAPDLQKKNVVVVVVTGTDQFDTLLQGKPNIVVLREPKPKVRTMFGFSPTGIMLVGIDRAGFLRRVEPLKDSEALGLSVSLMGDVTPTLEVGKPAPDFSIVDMNGTIQRLSDIRGRRNLILSFFPKCFTGGCANHLSSLGSEQLAFFANDTDILGVSFDPADGEHGQIAFAKKLDLDFPLIPDTGRNLAMLYEAAYSSMQPVPSRMSILIDKDGIVRLIDRQINVRTHGPDMLLKMRELGMAK